jgi:chemotaxis protein CheD
MERMLNINQFHVSVDPVTYTCFGLGSCIGLFITDRVKGLSGGAHIPMPAGEMGEFLPASLIINNLLDAFSSLGSDLVSLRAKVAGGAHVFETLPRVGEQNIKAVLTQLMEKKIFIVATDVGGTVSRTARFNSQTGDLLISTSEQKVYTI